MILLTLFISADTNVTDIIIETTGNLTLGEKITFAFNEAIDNIINGWITITGNLQVDGDTNITENLNVKGDFAVNNSVFFVDSTSENVEENYG